jgi:hypothetical protein
MRPIMTISATMMFAAFSGWAVADDHPVVAPTKDVTVEYTYDVKGGDGSHARHAKMYIAAGGKRARMEGIEGGSIIYDRANGHMFMVMEQRRTYMELPMDATRAGVFGLLENKKFTRKGTDSVAGMRCTLWEISDEKGSGTGCFTDDGVVLRGWSDGSERRMVMTATSVTFGPLAEGLFEPPAGYQKMQMPGMPPGAGRPGMPPRQQQKP